MRIPRWLIPVGVFFWNLIRGDLTIQRALSDDVLSRAVMTLMARLAIQGRGGMKKIQIEIDSC